MIAAEAAAWSVPSASRPGVEHTVRRLLGGRLVCTCEAAAYRRPCRHRLAVIRLLAGNDPNGDHMTVTSIDRPKPPTAPAPPEISAAALEALLGQGDLGKLTMDQRTAYYQRLCASLGLNPLSLPFRYISFRQDDGGGGGLALYAQKGATDQLRALHGVSITRVEIDITNDICRVTAHARCADGREDQDIGAVSIRGLSGQALGNALKRAVTQAKRRVTLSICGLGWLDESELDDIPTERIVPVNPQTGEAVSRTGEATSHERRPAPPAPARNAPTSPASAASPAPSPATSPPDKRAWNDRLDAFWRAVRGAGWGDPATVHAISRDLHGRPVDKLDETELEALERHLLSGQIGYDADGKAYVREEPPADKPGEEGGDTPTTS